MPPMTCPGGNDAVIDKPGNGPCSCNTYKCNDYGMYRMKAECSPKLFLLTDWIKAEIIFFCDLKGLSIKKQLQLLIAYQERSGTVKTVFVTLVQIG